MSNRPYCSPPLRVGAWNARSLKTKVSSLCDLRLVVLTISLWLNHGLPRTVVLPLSISRIHLKTTLFIIRQDPHAGGGLAVIARKGLHVSRNKGCILSSFKHFDLTITSGDKVYRLVTGYRPQPSKKKWLYSRKVFLRTLCLLRGVDCYILSIPCLW